jgi:hypothetical protein
VLLNDRAQITDSTAECAGWKGRICDDPVNLCDGPAGQCKFLQPVASAAFSGLLDRDEEALSPKIGGEITNKVPRAGALER